MVAVAIGLAGCRSADCRVRALGVRADERRNGRRGCARSGDEPGPQPLPPRHSQRLVSLAADASPASRDVCVRETTQPHCRLAGSAPPHGAGVATVDDLRGHCASRLHHAAAHCRQPARQGGVRRGHGGGVGRQEPAPRARRPARARALHPPNAKTLRFVESGSLLALLHKWTLRTCFNAQEEIYLASMDEIEQVRTLHPQIGRYIGPPCVIRNGLISPRCTEGSHFCGVPVWRDFPNAIRRL